MLEPIYEIRMSNGDTGYADTIVAAMLAARTMSQDAEGSTFPSSVRRNGKHCMWATAACRHHIDEQAPDGATLTTNFGSA